MLPRQHRLFLRERFTPDFQAKTPYFIIKRRKNSLDVSRFAFIVSKRVDKRAVVRNKVKRVMRRRIEEQLASVPVGYDMLFIVTRPVGQAKERLLQEVDAQLKRLQ